MLTQRVVMYDPALNGQMNSPNNYTQQIAQHGYMSPPPQYQQQFMQQQFQPQFQQQFHQPISSSSGRNSNTRSQSLNVMSNRGSATKIGINKFEKYRLMVGMHFCDKEIKQEMTHDGCSKEEIKSFFDEIELTIYKNQIIKDMKLTGIINGGESRRSSSNSIISQNGRSSSIKEGRGSVWSSLKSLMGGGEGEIGPPGALFDSNDGGKTSRSSQNSRNGSFRSKSMKPYEQIDQDWTAILDTQANRYYYWNKRTGVTSWTHPFSNSPTQVANPASFAGQGINNSNKYIMTPAGSGYDISMENPLRAVSPNGARRNSPPQLQNIPQNGLPQTNNRGSTQQAPPQQPPPLQQEHFAIDNEWVQILDSNRNKYYFWNTKTGVTSWNHPNQNASSPQQQQQPVQAPAPQQEAPAPVPAAPAPAPAVSPRVQPPQPPPRLSAATSAPPPSRPPPQAPAPSSSSSGGGGAGVAEKKYHEQEKFSSFALMYRMKVGEADIRKKMKGEGNCSDSEINQFFQSMNAAATESKESITKSGTTPAAASGGGAKFHENEEYKVYLKMYRMKIPELAVRQKMKTNGLTDDIIDKFFIAVTVDEGG